MYGDQNQGHGHAIADGVRDGMLIGALHNQNALEQALNERDNIIRQLHGEIDKLGDLNRRNYHNCQANGKIVDLLKGTVRKMAEEGHFSMDEYKRHENQVFAQMSPEDRELIDS